VNLISNSKSVPDLKINRRDFMPKVKVLTVQFDVTGFSQEVIDELQFALEVQGQDLVVGDEEHEVEHLRSNTSEVDVDDV
jgi:ribosomal protein L1